MDSDYAELFKRLPDRLGYPDPERVLKLVPNNPLGFFDKTFPAPSDEDFKRSLEEALANMKMSQKEGEFYEKSPIEGKIFGKTPIYSPIIDEVGLFYRMNASGDNYRWEVVDKEDGSEYKFSVDAKNKSLREAIQLFKEEFYGK